MTSFQDFLSQNKSRAVQRDGERVEIFNPNAPANEQFVHAAEVRLGVPLPASYKTFLQVCGSGQWCGDYVAPPEDLYPFDKDCGDMEGLSGSSTMSVASATSLP